RLVGYIYSDSHLVWDRRVASMYAGGGEAPTGGRTLCMLRGVSNARRTPLYDRHVELGARMVDFAGFAMPVQYKGGIKHEHLAVRNALGVFDVSHMGELRVRGDKAASAVRRLVTGDTSALAPG